MKYSVIMITLFWCFQSLLHASQISPQNKNIHVPEVNSELITILIDGKIDEPIWQKGLLIEDFHQVKPEEFQTPTQKTQTIIMFHKHSLYIAARLYDNPSLIAATQFIQGRSNEHDDQFHVTIDAFNNQRTGVFFQLNPNGIRSEALIENDAVHGDWKTIWDGAALINDEGWTLEMRIPYQSFSFDPKAHQWGINFGRVIRRHNEIIAWSSQGIDSWEMAPAVAGTMNSPKIVSNSLGIDIEISGVTSHFINRNEQTTEDKMEPSLDIFYKPSSALTLAATLNTDFSATEVDERVINLSRFSVFLPEKRSFFLQDTDIFEFADLSRNGRPFFSRTIGIDEGGVPVDITGGIKLTGRIKGMNYGIMNVSQDNENLPGNENLFVARLSTDLFDESTLGIITTQGNPLTDTSSSLWGVDFNYRNSNALNHKLLQGNLWYQQTSEESVAANPSAYGFTLAYPNDDLFLRLRHKTIEENFSPAMGFVNRDNIKETIFNYGHSVHIKDSIFRTWNPWLHLEYVSDTNRRMLGKEITFYPATFHFIDNHYFEIHSTRKTEIIEEAFTIFKNITIQPGRYEETRHGIRVVTPEYQSLFLDVEYEGGDFLSGKRDWFFLSINWRPFDRLLFSTDFEQTKARLIEGRFTAKLFRLNTEVAFNSDWSWMTTAQYDNGTKLIGINSRLRYQPTAGQAFSLVINHNMQNQNGAYRSLDSKFIAKINYSFRF